MKDITKIFEAADTQQSELIKQQSTLFADKLFKFDFTELTRSDIPITYYVAGYLARKLVKKTKCKSCQELLSETNEPLEVEVEESLVQTDGLAAGKAFLDAINRGGLVKPTELLFIACTHASDLYDYIRGDKKLLSELISCKKSQSLFIEVFMYKLERTSETRAIIETTCKHKHKFEEYIRQAAATMFNCFAKYLTSEINSELHESRKGTGTDMPEKVKIRGVRPKSVDLEDFMTILELQHNVQMREAIIYGEYLNIIWIMLLLRISQLFSISQLLSYLML